MHLETGSQTKTRNYKAVIYAVLVTLVIGLLYWPTLRWLFSSWLSSDYFSHGFLVPVLSGVIVWIKREQLKSRQPSSIGIYCLMLAAMLYIMALVWDIRVLGALSLITVIIGLIFTIFGTRAARALAFPLVFLVFMVPFPFFPDVAFGLQQISVSASSNLLEFAGLPVTTSGTEISLNNTVFSVGITCSGINTLVALLALAAVYVYILNGSVFRRTGLFILAFPLAMAGNILRIVSIIMVAYFVNIQTATGWYHDISSPVVFFVEFLILIGIARIMGLKINQKLFR